MVENGYNFKYVSKELRDDKDVALVALARNAFVLENVSERLSNDKEGD